jgi:hypothetical protein
MSQRIETRKSTITDYCCCSFTNLVRSCLKPVGTNITGTFDSLKGNPINLAIASCCETSLDLRKTLPMDFTCINPYNPVILKCIRANMDIQFITDVWACVAYIISYMCKPQKSMSDLMRNACKESATVKDKLKSIGNVSWKFLRHHCNLV